MLPALLPLLGSVLDKILPDRGAADKAKAELFAAIQAGEFKELEAQAAIVAAEAGSAHWITACWRPLTMLIFAAIVANNLLLYPYLRLFWPDAPVLELPPDMWGLLKVGLGGYVVGRSGEKIAHTLAAFKSAK